MNERASQLALGIAVVCAIGIYLFRDDLTQQLVDLFRTVILVEGVAVFVSALVIVRRYAISYRNDSAHSRLLPWHVVCLGMFSLLMALSAIGRIVYGVQGAIRVEWYGTPLILVAMTAGTVGLVSMVGWLPIRGPVAPSGRDVDAQ